MTEKKDRLRNIEKLLAMNLAENRKDNEIIKILHRIDYTSKEIGTVVGIPDGTVRRKISELREEGEIDD